MSFLLLPAKTGMNGEYEGTSSGRKLEKLCDGVDAAGALVAH
ncbi:MAG: hypothetical protein AAB227_06595 [Pseudomonadota bacterium]